MIVQVAIIGLIKEAGAHQQQSAATRDETYGRA